MCVKMFRLFYPYEYVDSVFSIDYSKLYELDFKGIIFDIDNTLVHHGDDSNEKIDELFDTIHKIGFTTLLLTNNDEARVKRFIKNIDTLYICEADKPKVKNYYNALKMMNLNKNEVVFVGDQVFTDIFGANKCGIPNILVKFIQLDKNEYIGKRRQIEQLILKWYSKNRTAQHRLGNVTLEELKNNEN